MFSALKALKLFDMAWEGGNGRVGPHPSHIFNEMYISFLFCFIIKYRSPTIKWDKLDLYIFLLLKKICKSCSLSYSLSVQILTYIIIT